MMTFLSGILGNSDIIVKGFKLIDDLHTSDEEHIKSTTKAKTDLLSAYAPFKIAQRYLAMIFALTFVASYIMVLTLYFVGNSTDDVTKIIQAFKIDWIMLTIVGFYFGGGAFEGVIASKKK
jgi:hypothetical protein